MELKKCTKCKKKLPSDNIHFYKQSRTRDGLSTRCKVCIRIGRKLDREAKMTSRYCKHTRCSNLVKSNGSRKLFCSKECRLASYRLIMKDIYNEKQMLDRRVRRASERALLDMKSDFKNGGRWSSSDKEFLINYMKNGLSEGRKVMVLHSELSDILGRTSASIDRMYSKLSKIKDV